MPYFHKSELEKKRKQHAGSGGGGVRGDAERAGEGGGERFFEGRKGRGA